MMAQSCLDANDCYGVVSSKSAFLAVLAQSGLTEIGPDSVIELLSQNGETGSRGRSDDRAVRHLKLQKFKCLAGCKLMSMAR